MSTRLVFLSVATALTGLFFRLPVHAQTPTPTPVQTVEVEVAGDIVDARYDLTWVVNEIINITNPIPGLGNRFAQWASQIWPTNDVHDLPNLEKYGNWLRRSDPALTPKVIKDATIDFTTEQVKTYTSRLCVVDYKTGGMAVDMVSNRRIKSEPVEWINPLDQHGERFNSYIGRRKQTDQNYDRPSEIVRLDSARPCSWQNTALNVREIELTTNDLNQYGAGTVVQTPYSALDFIVGILEKIEQGVRLVFAQTDARINGWILFTERLSHAEPMCNIFGCESSDLSPAPIDAPEKERLAKDKGFVLSFKPRVLSYRNEVNSARPNPFTTNTGRTQSIETRTYLTKVTKDSLDYLTCTLIPKVKQGEVMGQDFQETECQYAQTTATCGSKELPDLSGVDSSCGMCNTGGIRDFIASVNPAYANQLPEGNLPSVAIDILNKAASTYNVPAPVLFGAMIQEGSFTWDDWQWSAENVTCWSVEGGKIGQTTFGDDASCLAHAHPATGSRGAFGWIETRFAPYSDAVHTVDPGRQELDQCNFMDAAFAAAKSMSDTQGGGPSTPASCNGIPLLQSAGRRSCGAWDESRAATAQYTYNGSCTAAVPRTVNAFRQFKCF